VKKHPVYRSDTKLSELEDFLGINFNVKPREKLSTFFKKKGYPALAKLMEKKSK